MIFLALYRSQQLLLSGSTSPKEFPVFGARGTRLALPLLKQSRLNECPFMDFKCLPFAIHLMSSILILFSPVFSQLDIFCVQGNHQDGRKPRQQTSILN